MILTLWKYYFLKQFCVIFKSGTLSSSLIWRFPLHFPYRVSRRTKVEKARGKDVIDDSVNNGSGFQPIDIINDHLPELQRVRSIIRNADVVGRHFSRSLFGSHASPTARVVVSSFGPALPPLQRHRLRVIPAWAGISFFRPPSWRFAKIHSSPASEGANKTPQKPARRKRKELARKWAEANQGGGWSLSLESEWVTRIIYLYTLYNYY